MSRFEIDAVTGQFKPKPQPDPEYLEHYSKEALEAMGEDDAEELFDGISNLDPELKVSVDVPETNENDIEYGLADRRYEQFAHIESWDDVVCMAASLRVDIDQKQFELGALVNFACPKKRTGRPKDEDAEAWNVAKLAFAIGEDRSTLSQLANNETFWHPGIREELPPQVSWRQLARARVDSGWKPGKPVLPEQLTQALKLVLKMADGFYEKKKREEPSLISLAKRAERAAEKALDPERKETMGDKLKWLFHTILDTAADIIEELEDG